MKDDYDLQLNIDLWILDALLTGRDPRDGRGDPNTMIVIERFAARDLYYLSDGGYSRIGLNDETLRIHLTDNSRDPVKARWDNEDIQRVRRRIEATVRKWAEV